MGVIVPATGGEGYLVAKMTVHRNEIIEWNATNDGENRIIAYVYATEQEDKRVRIDVQIAGRPPPWFGRPHQNAMATKIRAHIREMEAEYYRVCGLRFKKH